MRVKVLKAFMSPYGSYEFGDVVDLDEAIAKTWLEGGLVSELNETAEVEKNDVGGKSKRSKKAPEG